MKSIVAVLGLLAGAAQAHVAIDVCGETVAFKQVPQRAIANDINMLKIMVALDLTSNMAGYSGVSGYHKMPDELALTVKDLPEIAPKYPSMENLLNADADFYFAGWNYGMEVGGAVTPSTLAKYNIPTYAIKESCAHVQTRPYVSLEDTFYDIDSIGAIFNVPERAKALNHGFKQRLAEVELRLAGAPSKAVFVYDSGEDKPFTAGALAVPHAIIAAAGGHNVMANVKQSWTRVSWEAVVETDPEHIVIIDYGQPSAAEKIAFLKRFPATQGVKAVVNNRFTILSYAAATPGIENIDAVEQLAKDLYPQRFK